MFGIAREKGPSGPPAIVAGGRRFWPLAYPRPREHGGADTRPPRAGRTPDRRLALVDRDLRGPDRGLARPRALPRDRRAPRTSASTGTSTRSRSRSRSRTSSGRSPPTRRSARRSSPSSASCSRRSSGRARGASRRRSSGSSSSCSALRPGSSCSLAPWIMRDLRAGRPRGARHRPLARPLPDRPPHGRCPGSSSGS